jgi:RimJ/RimL family protein N-acetyltransferase
MISIRKMVESDLSFFCEIRNECALEYLHNSRQFTIEESLIWFRETNPNFYLIEINGIKIGYFRTSNYDSVNKTIYIGCDIHVDYRGQGLAYKSYVKFIPFIFKEFNVDTINLEVLSTNERAKNLYKKIGFKSNNIKDNVIVKNGKDVLSEFWYLTKEDFYNRKTCYIITLFFGDRRSKDIPLYYENKLCFLEKHIELLTNLKHNLSKIIFVINTDDNESVDVKNALSIIPNKLNNSDVEVVLRQNIGMSYGAWSDCFLVNKDKFDYFIFNEDDYFFVIDNFDTILIEKFESREDSGYLCGIVSENKNINQPLHAAHSTGISSNTVLSKVVEVHGELPHSKSNDYGNVEINSQVKQTNSMIELGYNLYDLRDEYKIYFDYTGNIKEFFPENNKIIIQPWKLVI